MAETKGYSIDTEKKTCVTPECRGSYVSLLEPRKLPQSETLAWGMQCIFAKTPVVEAWVTDLKNIYGQVLIDKFGREKAGAIAKILLVKKAFPVRDGDDPSNAGALANAEQLKGCYFLNANNRFKQPHIIGPMGKALDPETLTPDDIYSGAYYRVMLEFWYYDTAGNKGISTSIAAAMKTRDGDNLGVGTTKSEATNAFTDFASEASEMFSNATGEEENTTEEVNKSDDTEFNFM